MDINSLIASYLQNNSNTEVDPSKIRETFKDLASDVMQSDSIFVYGEDATKEELIEYMSKAAGKDDDEFKENVGLLFDVLNANSDDDVLTTDELENLTRTRGDHKGKIDGFGIWNELLNTNVSDIEYELADLQLTDLANSIANSEDPKSRLEYYAIKYGKDSEEYKSLEQRVMASSSSTTESADKLSDNKINTWAEDILKECKTDEDIQKQLEFAKDDLSEEDYKKLEKAINDLKAKQTSETTQTNETSSESVASTDTEDPSEPEAPIYGSSPETTVVSTEAKIPNDDAVRYAEELLNGVVNSNAEKINQYLELDSADLVKVISTYTNKKQYGSFTKAIEAGMGEYLTKEERTAIINKVMSACIEQAKNGSDDAIAVLCNEIYSATAQTWGYTGYNVLDSFFANADNDVIRAVKEKYSEHIEGHDLRSDINGEAMWLHQNEKTSYIVKIDKSWEEET